MSNIEELEQSKNQAYWERNQLVALLSKLYPAWLEGHPESDASWDKDWMTIVMIQTPEGQASWHIHDDDIPYFAHLKKRDGNSWDGHTTEEKYDRLRRLGTFVATVRHFRKKRYVEKG